MSRATSSGERFVWVIDLKSFKVGDLECSFDDRVPQLPILDCALSIAVSVSDPVAILLPDLRIFYTIHPSPLTTEPSLHANRILTPPSPDHPISATPRSKHGNMSGFSTFQLSFIDGTGSQYTPRDGLPDVTAMHAMRSTTTRQGLLDRSLKCHSRSRGYDGCEFCVAAASSFIVCTIYIYSPLAVREPRTR